MSGWVAVDLDGTLAFHTRGMPISLIGQPIYSMLNKVKFWQQNGVEVRIFTARVADGDEDQIQLIRTWLKMVGLDPGMEITATKDSECIEIWDDRAVQVIPNSGMALDPSKNNPRHIPGSSLQNT